MQLDTTSGSRRDVSTVRDDGGWRANAAAELLLKRAPTTVSIASLSGNLDVTQMEVMSLVTIASYSDRVKVEYVVDGGDIAVDIQDNTQGEP